MGKSKKHKTRRSTSSSCSNTENNDSVNPTFLAKRLSKLEAEIGKRHFFSFSRSQSRSKVPSRYESRRRSRSRSRSHSHSRRAVSRERDGACSRYRRDSRDEKYAESPRAVANLRNNSNTDGVCSAVSVIETNACSDNSPDRDELVIHNDIILPPLPDDVLKMLGDDPEQDHNDSFLLHEQLVGRWRAIFMNGLKNNDSVSLLHNYDIPSNLTNPKLNPEGKAALLKANVTTDLSYVEVQNQLGKGLSALGKSITIVLNNVEKISEDRYQK